jgi:hypothetical protein
VKLADLRLKEIFTHYTKQHSQGGGKTLTFDKLTHGYESLTQFAL